MELLHRIRAFIMPTLLLLFAGSWVLTHFVSPYLLWAALPMTFLLAVAFYDRSQKQHSVMRNYPLLGRLRYLFESAGPSSTSTSSRATPAVGPSTATSAI